MSQTRSKPKQDRNKNAFHISDKTNATDSSDAKKQFKCKNKSIKNSIVTLWDIEDRTS